jgi:predicted TIM-barrel fold metal-dependent hydrolase
VNIQTPIALPDDLKSLAGQIHDVDSHEMMPAQAWMTEFGPCAKDLAAVWLNDGRDVTQSPLHPNAPGYKDNKAVEASSIWTIKGVLAPGATDVSRREAVMDTMGVKRQNMFGTSIMTWGSALYTKGKEFGFSQRLPAYARNDLKAFGRALLEEHNEWLMRVARVSSRVRPVPTVMADTLDELMTTARTLIDAGIRVLRLPTWRLVGGRSPAHSDLDPFWKLMTDNKITVVTHVGQEHIFPSNEWNKAPVFDGFRVFDELSVDPWSLANMHVTTENFLMTMIVGAVFERHPDLRFGVLETCAYWVGPLCDNLDMWYEEGGVMQMPNTYRLPRKPSDYIKRNVRVSAFDFERVDKYITKYDLADVLCFASDYPHAEGGKDPVGRWYNMLKPLGRDIVEKFYVHNGKWILPD